MKYDNKNFILAIVLSMLIIFGWQYFYAGPIAKKQAEQQTAQQTTATSPTTTTTAGGQVPPFASRRSPHIFHRAGVALTWNNTIFRE